MHKADEFGSMWCAMYDEKTNSLIPVENMQPNKISRGSEDCPVQDFVVAHFKSLGLSWTDNSWRDCTVLACHTTDPYKRWNEQFEIINLRELVRKHFSLQ